MKISVRNLEPTKVRLTITVDNDELKPYLDNARTEIAKQVNIPGFRKGHVPGKLVEQRFGFGAIAGDAVQEAVPDFYNKAVQEKDLRPMAQAKLDVKDIPDSEDSDTKLKFTAEVEVRPKFDLPEIEGMEVEVPPASSACARAMERSCPSIARPRKATSSASTSALRSMARPSIPRRA